MPEIGDQNSFPPSFDLERSGQRPYERPIPHHAMKEYAENLFFRVGYASTDPKEFQKTFQSLAVIMCIADSGCLTADQYDKISGKLQNLYEAVQNGSIKIHDLQEKLLSIIEITREENSKARVYADLIDLEYLLHLNPPNQLVPMDKKEFDILVEPIEKKIQQDLTSFEFSAMGKVLEHLISSLQNDPSSTTHAQVLEQLRQLGINLKK